MKNEIAKEGKWKALSMSSYFPIIATIIVLLVEVVLGLLLPHVLSLAHASSITGVLGALSPSSLWGFAIGAIGMVLILLFRQDELAVTAIIAVHLYLDWYLGMTFVAPIVSLGLLLIFFLARSPVHPWAEPPALWLWALLLVIAIFPTTRAPNFLYGADYYVNIIFTPLIMLWLGILIARGRVNLRSIFQMLAVFGTLVAIHSIIQVVTGVFFLESTRRDTDALIISYLDPSAVGVHRIESFLLNADSGGAFFAIMLFIPLGLLIECSSFLPKILYLAETIIAFLALLFTYSTGAWVAAFAGIIVFIALVGSTRYRVQISLFLLLLAIVMIVWFLSEVALLYYHTTDPQEVLLRTGAWQTGIRVIQAFPLTGLGIGRDVYLLHAQPYRVLAQFQPVAHPHDSYIELAALGGIPVAIAFIALLLISLRQAVRNWMRADASTRSLLAGGIAAVVALSVDSLSNAGWTLSPLAAVGWLILGVVSSPLLLKSLHPAIQTGERVAVTHGIV